MATTLTETQHDVQNWVEHSLAGKNLANISVEITRGVNGDGFLGDIVFAKVSAEKNGTEKEYHLVLKFGKNNEMLRENMPITDLYKQEIYMYDVVFPAYDAFLREKRHGTLNFVPRCYKTVDKFKSELIVLDNLKALGYKLYDQRTSMNVGHIEEVLKTYGRWHAISFAMQDQRKEDFDKLCAHLINIVDGFTKHDECMATLEFSHEKFRECLSNLNKPELLRRFDKVVEKGIRHCFEYLNNEIPSKTVITHGDCWNNNFMFKYGNSKDRPEKVAILDWQMSFKLSPVFDLSYFLYAVSSKNELDQVDRLLSVYHKSLSENITKLGSDPQKSFPFEELMEQWRKFSLFGFITSFNVFQFALCEEEDAPELVELSAENNFESMMQNLKIKNISEFERRVFGNVDHYVNYHNIA